MKNGQSAFQEVFSGLKELGNESFISVKTGIGKGYCCQGDRERKSLFLVY